MSQEQYKSRGIWTGDNILHIWQICFVKCKFLFFGRLYIAHQLRGITLMGRPFCVDWLGIVWQNWHRSNTTKCTHSYGDSTQVANSVCACMYVWLGFRQCLICFCFISFVTRVVPVKHSIITHTNSDYSGPKLSCVAAWFVLQSFSHQNP